jgi:transcriptional regulator with XRE-family HTH domain
VSFCMHCGCGQPETLGERIRMARCRMGLSQVELGNRVGYAENTVHRIEVGIRKPSLQGLRALARETNTSIDWLLEGAA